MGPAPFRFEPSGGNAVEGQAFSLPFKLLATVIVGGCAFWLAQLWSVGALGTAKTGGLGWFLAGIALMGWTWFHIMTSRTRIDREGLHQRWIWDKHMALDDLAFGKLIRVRGLDWLIAPRLYVRTLVGKFAVFYAATPELIAEFERLIAELKQARKL
ncbi:hypothetical protein QTH89_11205 [Variovorax sp. J22G21]|uniref:hypothetical protein n=1 Tax=Variovorax fucosicus TaxID=3053517 RepID=UPI00257598FE|nr:MULTISPECIES: hypothetical protein [unclassified Variovorax]MDM0040396.1 hypothetical protein [Variovorax sp. J22R193]MDM0061769.1 hypothetical protein [Variovorax sp. J22G21]